MELAFDEATARLEAERCLNCRRCLGCKLCEEACKPGAINYMQGPEEVRVDVGSVIVAAGLEEYDPAQRPELGYGVYKNVVTSTEFERILSATGPTSSMVMRPSDGKVPKKVAWLQCVGSRDKTNEYCSSVCCMYATKEAIIAKEHQHDIEPTIFYMDVRAFGKGFDQYYERAKHEHGVRYVKSSISRILEDPETTDLEVVYVDEEGRVASEMFDLAVLSVGIRPSRSLPGLARGLGIGLNEYGFRPVVPTEPRGHDKGRHLRERRVGSAEGHPRDGDAGVGRRMRGGLRSSARCGARISWSSRCPKSGRCRSSSSPGSAFLSATAA